MAEIGGVASLETVLVAANLPVSVILVGDYIWRHRCLADYFNAQFLTRADHRVGSQQPNNTASQATEDLRSQGTFSRPSDLLSSPGVKETAGSHEK